ncbi:MAG: 6,7-dimethyl-8-ribityllumazine synthase [Xanthomonadales bacterium]|jgi:6,7-dimethyl-8-ribityllumazine synthase|nr:6,7-dimethyl-8-ribityllumazine synthase [Xanthomonadales bacterium]
MFEIEEPRSGRELRVAIVAARFNRFIVEQLLEGALDALDKQGIDDERRALVWVPGAFELPTVADRFAASGRYDAIIALGAVIRGGTPHFDFVAAECASGLNRVALEYGVPVAFGVLTTDSIEQAIERAAPDQGNKGFDVTLAAIELARTLEQVDAHVDGLPGK